MKEAEKDPGLNAKRRVIITQLNMKRIIFSRKKIVPIILSQFERKGTFCSISVYLTQ